MLLLAALPAAWLVPNHYPPWLSAWSEGWALLALAMALLTTQRAGRIPLAWAAFCALALATVAAQAATGVIFFAGDAGMAALYLIAFAAAIATGGALGQAGPSGRQETAPIDAFAFGMLACAIASVGVAVVQWTGAVHLGLLMAELPPGERPFGNVAQPNHLSTVCYLGLCGLGILHQHRRVAGIGFGLAAFWLLTGMVMTGSRTGWLQVAFMLVFVVASARHGLMLLSPKAAAGLGALFVGCVLAWPVINDRLMLSSGRSLADAAEGGTRWRHWRVLWDAIGREPLTGYGWQQVSVAQVRVADAHAYVGEHIEHSHNIVLDLLVWNGVLAGGVLTALAAWWLGSRLARCRDPAGAWLLIAVGGLVIHGMLEFPLEYAYFVLPLGIAIGAVDTRQPMSGGLRVGVWQLRSVGAALTAWLALVGADYLRAEEGHRLLRLESARIGTAVTQTPPPELMLLTQLGAFFRFAHTEARPGLSPDELESMRRVSERFAYPSAMFRYALALGLNDQGQAAELTLKRLCRMHAIARCVEARDGWRALQLRFPGLRSIGFPPLPERRVASS